MVNGTINEFRGTNWEFVAPWTKRKKGEVGCNKHLKVSYVQKDVTI